MQDNVLYLNFETKQASLTENTQTNNGANI